MRKIGSLGIFLTRRCNLSCIYCCTQRGADPPDKMTAEELKSAVRQAREMGARWLVIPGEGEPLLDENLFPLIEFASTLGMRTKIYTNGSRVDEPVAARLFANGVAIVFKLHAIDPGGYDLLAGGRSGTQWEEYRGVQGGTARIPRGLRLLLQAGYDRVSRLRSGESLLQIASVVVNQNLAFLPDVACWCRAQGIDLLAETLLPFAGDGPEARSMAVAPQAEAALFRELRKILGWRFGVAQRVRCRFETDPFLDISGRLRHCFALPADVGNIRTAPLVELHKRELALRTEKGLLSWPISPRGHGFRCCASRRFLRASPLPGPRRLSPP